MHYAEAKLGRIFLVRLHDGDHLPDVLESFAEELKISNALCLLLGVVKDKGRIISGPLYGNKFPPEPITQLLEGENEVVGMGTIFENEEGKPKLHMHASFGREEKARVGCTRMGIDIWQIGEVFVLEMIGLSAKRKMDKKTSFEFLEVG